MITLPTINISGNQELGLDYVISTANSTLQTQWNTTESGKVNSAPKNAPYTGLPYSPITSTDYLNARINDILNSYYSSFIKARQSDPTNAAVLNAVLSLPAQQFAQVVTTVQSLISGSAN